MQRPAPKVARLSREVAGLCSLADAVEERLDEVDSRTTALAIGAGNVAEALERTEALTDKLEALEARAIVLEAAMAKRARVRQADAVTLAGPALAWVKGQISPGAWADTLTDWLNGKRAWTAADFMREEPLAEPPPWMTDEDEIPW